MQSIQRQYGRVMHRGAEDDAKVTVLINDYNNSDQALASVSELMLSHFKEPANHFSRSLKQPKTGVMAGSQP